MRRRVLVMGAVCAVACAAEEPEDATTTEASSVGLTSGVSTTGEGDSSSGTTGDAEATVSSSTAASSSGAPLEVDYEADVQPIWNANCTCHLMGNSGTMVAPFLTLNPDVSHGQLVDTPAEQAALDRVVPGSLSDSYAWLKLTDAHEAVGDGTVMPQTGMLEPAQLDVIEAWIVAGAEP